MIDINTQHRLARTRHEEQLRSLITAPEYDNPLKAHQPRRMSWQAGQLLYALGTRLASLGERMKDSRVGSQ